LDAVQLMVPLVLAALASAAATPLAARLAAAVGAVDRPNDRKVNERDGIPLLGGIAVMVGCVVGLASFHLLVGEQATGDRKILGFLAGSAIVLALGAWDDRFSLGAGQKFPSRSWPR
jgi:UDP-GlcNAc:undecaprenyl-phosphate GlcNAc-1-phosphate transferase